MKVITIGMLIMCIVESVVTRINHDVAYGLCDIGIILAFGAVLGAFAIDRQGGIGQYFDE